MVRGVVVFFGFEKKWTVKLEVTQTNRRGVSACLFTFVYQYQDSRFDTFLPFRLFIWTVFLVNH
jgi:hypothetical protein